MFVIIWYFSAFYPHVQYTGNVLARVQRVHKPVDLWDITFAPVDFEALTNYFWHPRILRPRAISYR